jgi:hypothetical protein
MDAGLDVETREKLEHLATQFSQSRAAVLRQQFAGAPVDPVLSRYETQEAGLLERLMHNPRNQW